MGTTIPKGLIPSGEEGVAKSMTTEAYGGSASHDRGPENREMLKPRQAYLQRPSPRGLLPAARPRLLQVSTGSQTMPPDGDHMFKI